MKKLVCLFLFALPILSSAQQPLAWTEDDRKLLVENLIRSRDEIIKETEGLSPKQSNFKESEDRWSINQVVEHVAMFELIFDREISRALQVKPQPDVVKEVKPDSFYTDFIMEEAVHVTTNYTKPYTYTVPMGLNDIKNNVAWFLRMRNESIEYVKATKEDLRQYWRNGGVQDVHQTFLYMFGHVDRHLRQIKKIKQDPKYPKK